MSQARRKVIISNVFTDHNKGGAAITAQTIECVQRAVSQADVRLVTVRHEADGYRTSHRFTARRFPDITIRGPLVPPAGGPFAGIRAAARSLWLLLFARRLASSPALREIVESQLVVSKGGHVFVERGGIRRALSLWMTSLPLLLARRFGVPTAVLCTTVGPFTTWHSRAVAGFVLRRVTRLVVRDDNSLQEALALGVEPARVTSLPDIVFAASPPTAERCLQVAARFGLENSRFCVVTVSEGTADGHFFEQLGRTLHRLLDGDTIDRVIVVRHAREDIALSRRFIDGLDDARASCLEEDLSPDDLLALYGAASCLIGRRMHSAIFALVAGIPTFAFTKTGMKVQGVMASLGLDDLVMTYPDFDPMGFAARIERELRNPEVLRNRIAGAVQGAATELDRIPGILSELLAGDGVPAPAGAEGRRTDEARSDDEAKRVRAG
jgi:polysaccharide pyruvyl transferase WcaK-like protein